MVRTCQSTLKLDLVHVQTDELVDVLLECTFLFAILQKVVFFVAQMIIHRKFIKNDAFTGTLVHFYHSNVDLADARIMHFVLVGTDLQEADRYLKIVLLCIERLWIVLIHVFQHSVHNKARLFVLDELLKL